MLRSLLIVFLLSTAASSFADKANSNPLVIGSEQDYPPFAIGKTDAAADGFSVDLWKAVAVHSDIPYTIRVRPFHQILQEFKDGKIDVLINLAQSEDRRQFADFTVPHVTVHPAIFVRKGLPDIRTESDLTGKSIIVVQADIAYEYAMSHGLGQQLVKVETADEGLRLLASGFHDAMLINKLVGMQRLQALKLDNIKALGLIHGASQKFSFAVAKDNSELLARINEGLALTKASGEYDVLFDKWFSVYELTEISFRDSLKYLMPFFMAFTIILGIVIYRRQTERQRANELLRASEERWKFALEGSGDGVWDWNVQTGEVLFSTGWKEMLGFDQHELSNRVEEWTQRVHPEELAGVMDDVQAYFDGRTLKYINEHRLRCKDGSWKWILDRGIVVSRTEDDKPLRMVGTHTDITKLKESEETIWKEANFDPLTGLPNRRMFYDRLEQEIKKANRTDNSLALLFLDLDRFKEVNDTLGHAQGDLLLQEAAVRLGECVRDTDTVARLGGDEFIIILGELGDEDKVERIAQKILHELCKPFRLNNEFAYITASIGITLYPNDALKVDDLMKNVDQAMYAAKNQGRNRFSYFTISMQQAAQARMQVANDLRTALAEQQFEVFYQPIIALGSKSIHKAEALIRWQHPVRGMILPAEFITVAEDNGLIIDIGEWVFRETVAQVKRWREKYHPQFQISINKSPVQFYNEKHSHAPWFEYLQQAGLPGQSIVVEITEGLLLDASSIVINTLLEFRDAGIQVSLDDFGTGYSSLSYLKKFDIDYIKIDRSFVSHLSPQSDDLALCEAIIEMAHKLGMQVIAEGVETLQQCELLHAAGCDFAQGYLFSEPVTAEAFEKLLQSGIRET